jgi:class 3 adenylate cyclase/CHASE2 domain-containing sensor protein
MHQQRELFGGYLAIAVALVLLALLGAARHFDLKLLDQEFRLLRKWRVVPANPDVVLIGIDEETVRTFPEPFALWHRYFADVLQVLAVLKPAAVGLDVVLPERSYDSIAPGHDRDLVRALILGRTSFPLVLGLTSEADGRVRSLHAPFASAVGEGGTGLALFPVDADNVVRRFDERLAEDGAQLPTLAGQLSRKLGREPGQGVIDYSVGPAFDYVPMHAFLAAAQAGEVERLRSAFAGKIVLIGPALRFEDHKPQPVNLAGWETSQLDAPGLLLHAQSLRSILGGGLIRDLSPAWSVALALVFALLWFVPAGLWRTPVLVLLSGAALAAGSLVLLEHRIHLAIGLPLVAVAIAAGARVGLQATRAFLQRRRLREALVGYVSPQIAEDVIAGRVAAGFEGRRYHLCVMFVDMRDFTPRSERMEPEDLMRLVNRCFEEFVAAVHESEGTVVQFLGDGIMAFFGAPNPLANPSDAAMGAAEKMFGRLEGLNMQLRSQGIAPIRIGVGLNVGDAVVGNVGASSRYGYAAVGDVVNVAARLEGLTKELGYPLVCSRAVAEAASMRAGLVALGAKSIKGHSAVEVYGWNPLAPKD